MAHKIKLGELLVRAGVLDESRLKSALSEQERWGGRLGSVLVGMGFVSEEILVKALSKQLAVPMAQLDKIEVPPHILKKVDIDFAKMNAVCPERFLPEKRALVVAMADPINVSAIDEIVRRTGCRVQPTVAGERAIMRAINGLYGAEAPDAASGKIEVFGEARQQQLEMARATAQAAMNGGLPSFSPPALQQQAPSGPPTPAAQEMVATLDAAQKKQLKAIRAMADLLIEKGLISREEYFARINRRG